MLPGKCGQKHGGRARRGVAVDSKVTFLGLWPEKGWKVEDEREARGLVKLTFGTLRRKCVLFCSPATHTLGNLMRMSWAYNMVR